MVSLLKGLEGGVGNKEITYFYVGTRTNKRVNINW